MHKGHIVTGTVAGTGAALNVPLGFVPEHVIIENTSTSARLEWFNDMADGTGIHTAATGARSQAATGGITPYDGASGQTGAGFTIGTHAINGSGNDLRYYAFSADS